HFVRRDTATGHFHLSCRLLALAFAYAERVGIPGLCAPILQALANETGELVQLAVVEGGCVLFVAKAEGTVLCMRLVAIVSIWRRMCRQSGSHGRSSTWWRRG